MLDDGSTDDSLDIVSRYDDPRIRIERNERNLGIPATRNRGLELARGEYIALLDSDDLAAPNRLERQVAFLDAHPQFAEIGSWCRFVDETATRKLGLKRHAIDPRVIAAEMPFRCPISNRSVLGRAKILREHPYREAFPVCSDVDVHARIARHHPIGNLPEVLVYGRQHGGRITVPDDARRPLIRAKIKRPLLVDLGLDPSADDLARHLSLGRKEGGSRVDAAYLAWAAEWLTTLHAANEATRRYDPATFSRVLGATWERTCWHGRRKLGWRLVREVLRTPWVRGAVESFARTSWDHVAKPQPA